MGWTYSCAKEQHTECPDAKKDTYECNCPCHLTEPLSYWLGDTVKLRGNSYETGVITGIVSSDENLVRVYWNSTNNLYHETISTDLLEIVKHDD
jgi:hypothetical protein